MQQVCDTKRYQNEAEVTQDTTEVTNIDAKMVAALLLRASPANDPHREKRKTSFAGMSSCWQRGGHAQIPKDYSVRYLRGAKETHPVPAESHPTVWHSRNE